MTLGKNCCTPRADILKRAAANRMHYHDENVGRSFLDLAGREEADNKLQDKVARTRT